ncbi:MAG: nucleotidyltransferase family protein [Lentisphaeria bacterium]|nr:nucleotidyltransferase family protein [Lentisphaeria bacterium]
MIELILLAAGKSSRMGRNKMMLPWGDLTVIESTISTVKQVAGITHTHILVSKNNEALQTHIQEFLCEKVSMSLNPDPDADMLSSIRIGLEACNEEMTYFLVLPGDMPKVNKETYELLLSSLDGCKRLVVPYSSKRKNGHPICIHSSLKEQVINNYDGVGLRGILEDYADQIYRLEVSDEVLIDIDTIEDYQHALGSKDTS